MYVAYLSVYQISAFPFRVTLQSAYYSDYPYHTTWCFSLCLFVLASDQFYNYHWILLLTILLLRLKNVFVREDHQCFNNISVATICFAAVLFTVNGALLAGDVTSFTIANYIASAWVCVMLICSLVRSEYPFNVDALIPIHCETIHDAFDYSIASVVIHRHWYSPLFGGMSTL